MIPERGAENAVEYFQSRAQLHIIPLMLDTRFREYYPARAG